MIRDEVLHLQVVVYNYMDQDLTNVEVTLQQSNDFLILFDGRLVAMSLPATRTIPVLKKQSITSVKFVISPINIGQLRIETRAVSDLAGDGQVKMLKVKAEGIQQFDIQSLLLSLRANSDPIVADFEPNLPPNYIKNSQSCWVQVIGNYFGFYLETMQILN